MSGPQRPRPITAALLREWRLPTLAEDADKEVRGAALVIAGSREVPGAAWLAGISALRAGCGKLVVATSRSVAPGLGLMLPEARVIGLPERKDGGIAARSAPGLDEAIEKADAILIGPGMDADGSTAALARGVLAEAPLKPVILDAGALAAALPGSDRDDHRRLLTPHAGELAHLMNVDKDSVRAEPLGHARNAAERTGAVVALKGASTVVALPGGRSWRHRGGEVGLATSGSGDVLAGVILGLAARGATLEQAAAWGVFIHAAAGRRMARLHGPVGYLAGELPASFPSLLHLAERP